MIIKYIEDPEVLQEIRNSLPTKRITYTPNVIFVLHQSNERAYVIKSRHREDTTLCLDIDSFVLHENVTRTWEDEFLDLCEKNVMIHWSILNKRGQEVLLSLT